MPINCIQREKLERMKCKLTSAAAKLQNALELYEEDSTCDIEVEILDAAEEAESAVLGLNNILKNVSC